MIKIFGTQTCIACKRAKDYFISHNIKYEDVDITHNTAARDEIISQGFRRIPVLLINNKFFDGTNLDNIGQILGI